MHEIATAALSVFPMQSLALLTARAGTSSVVGVPPGSAGSVYLRQTSKPSIARK